VQQDEKHFTSEIKQQRRSYSLSTWQGTSDHSNSQ